MIQFEASRALARVVLERPLSYKWSVQGFGMLRTYLDRDKRWRLNVWDSSLAVPGVSTIHDHPWHFTSLVLAGLFRNKRYKVVAPEHPYALPYMKQRIQTGEGGGPRGEAVRVGLQHWTFEGYEPGDTYGQEASEVHESLYHDGTVTLNDRTRLPDGDHANVFWPRGTEWVDAEPREPTAVEIVTVTGRALVQLGEKS